MNKFNEQKQIEETTAFQENQAMDELNNEQQFTSMAHKRRVERLQEDFQLTAPEGENSDDDSIGELSTQDGIIIDDSRWGRTTRPTRLPYFTDRVSEENKMDKFDLLMYALCIGTIVAGAVFGTWALFMTMSL